MDHRVSNLVSSSAVVDMQFRSNHCYLTPKRWFTAGNLVFKNFEVSSAFLYYTDEGRCECLQIPYKWKTVIQFERVSD